MGAQAQADAQAPTPARTRGCARARCAIAALLALGLAPSASAAQASGPPSPRPARPFTLPTIQSVSLSFGATLDLVESHEVPFVTIDLVFPRGSGLDPDGLEGATATAALLLTSGTSSRRAAEIVDALDHSGATLVPNVVPDRTVLTAATPLSALDSTLALLADVVRNPTFPAERVEAIRTRSLSALQALEGASATVADRVFDARSWGAGHPRGRRQTPRSTRALGRDDVVAAWARTGRPEGMRVVVSGAVELEDARRRIEEVFAGWAPDGEPVLQARGGEGVSRTAPEVVVVNRPGAVQAEIRVGTALPRRAAASQAELDLANRVLGVGPASRLFRRMREEEGFGYGVSSALEWTPEGPRFVASTAVRTEVAGAALDLLLAEIERLRREPISTEEFERVRNGRVGALPIELETPRQIAVRWIETWARGGDAGELTALRTRYAALDAETVQRAVESYLRADRMLIVVSGDALAIRPQLQALGPVTLLDADGREITLAQLEGGATADDRPTFSPAGLRPFRSAYDVRLNGRPFGEVVRTLEASADGSALTLRSETSVGPQSIDQTVTFGAEDFGFLRTTQTLVLQGQEATLDAELRDGRMVGSRRSALGEEPIDVALPPGAVVGDMAEMLLWVADLEVGGSFQLPFADPQTGTVQRLRVRVEGTERIQVPAGDFDTFRIAVGGSQPQTIWARVEAPHWVVRVTPAAQPVSIELRTPPSGR